MRRLKATNEHAIDMAETRLDTRPFLAAQHIALRDGIGADQKHGCARFGAIKSGWPSEKRAEIAIEPHFIGKNELTTDAEPP